MIGQHLDGARARFLWHVSLVDVLQTQVSLCKRGTRPTAPLTDGKLRDEVAWRQSKKRS